jgi:hypothetical protein
VSADRSLPDRVTFTDANMRHVLAAMRRAVPKAETVAATDAATAHAELQRRLSAGDINLSAFDREWRRLDRPRSVPGPSAPVDEVRLHGAQRLLERFGDLWADPSISGEQRQEAVRERFERIDVHGPDVVALHPQPNENAWRLGYAAMRDGSLTRQERVGMVGASGIAPPELSDLGPSF